MSDKGKKLPEATEFDGEIDMPHMPISIATTEWDATGTWRYLKPRFVERIPRIPSCQNHCPTGADIEAWIAHFERGDLGKAWDAATIENPFPSIMGRVCFHPCMDGCSRKDLGGAINIHALERTLGDAIGEKLPEAKPFFPSSGKKVAVVGSGPAGLACAYHLRRLGHEVTVFEKEKKAGGILRYGIPAYRLPRDVLDRELDRFAAMGIKFNLGKAVPDATHMQTLCQDYDAVFLAIGAHKSRSPGIVGEKTKGVIAGLAFLREITSGRKMDIGKRVLVIGGGNTAIDAARTALRLGRDVTLLYRRSRAEMPAFPDDVREAEDEGVKIETLVSPLEVVGLSGQTSGLRCKRVELGAPDDTGRMSPVPIEGSEFMIEGDTIITAIGEDIDTSIIPSAFHVDGGAIRTGIGGKTEWHNVFAGGDFTFNPRTVVDSLASGKASAIAVDCELRGEGAKATLDRCKIAGDGPVLMSRYVELRGAAPIRHSTTEELIPQDHVVGFEEINCAYFTLSDAATTPHIAAAERMGDDPFAEVAGGLVENIRAEELGRCFHCGRCTTCDNCFIYCPDVAVSKQGDGFAIDMDYCKGCGVCSEECPRAAMEMVEETAEVDNA
jgi:2-oxoacid:acceptor oxidoreductase delta subunit (pyruvate/2-ketoisovalerate family)